MQRPVLVCEGWREKNGEEEPARVYGYASPLPLIEAHDGFAVACRHAWGWRCAREVLESQQQRLPVAGAAPTQAHAGAVALEKKDGEGHQQQQQWERLWGEQSELRSRVVGLASGLRHILRRHD